MIYYLIIENMSPVVIGETTLGGTFLADSGWPMLLKIIKNFEDLTFKFEIKDEKNKLYSLDSFMDKVNRGGVIDQT